MSNIILSLLVVIQCVQRDAEKKIAPPSTNQATMTDGESLWHVLHIPHICELESWLNMDVTWTEEGGYVENWCKEPWNDMIKMQVEVHT